MSWWWGRHWWDRGSRDWRWSGDWEEERGGWPEWEEDPRERRWDEEEEDEEEQVPERRQAPVPPQDIVMGNEGPKCGTVGRVLGPSEKEKEKMRKKNKGGRRSST